MPSYLEQMTTRLAAGLGALPESLRQRHAKYLLGTQQADGGFAGREGGSDLYYTGFALRSLAILGELYGPAAERAADFLRGRLTGRESTVDFLSLIYGAMLLDSAAGIDVFADVPGSWRDTVSDALEKLRRPDGGYAKTAEGIASSTYHGFLVLICRELIERPLPDPDKLIAFLLSQQDPEGGFREIRVSKRASTNPTAAAIAALRVLDALPEASRESTIDFLADMQTDEGGLRANTRIPIADLLSTFTGLLTLLDLGAGDAVEQAPLRRYALSLEVADGGFQGATLDPSHDVEYTFYGLGCLALLADNAAAP